MILVVNGGVRAASVSAALTDWLMRSEAVSVFAGLAELPAFDDPPEVPAPIEKLRGEAGRCAGVAFVTPEYAYGMPGALKNALDWLVGSGELYGKPALVVSASSSGGGGVRAQLQLAQTLAAMGLLVVDSVAVPFVRDKVCEGLLTDAHTQARLDYALAALSAAVTT